MGELLELSLELRTTQTTAVLLSVSEPEGYPALSLELNQGKVIISGDMGDRRPFRVEQTFQSEFAICDNKWHRIQAFYVEDKLTLKVDQFEQKYWLLDNGHITGARTHSPLYIGGLPGGLTHWFLRFRLYLVNAIGVDPLLWVEKGTKIILKKHQY